MSRCGFEAREGGTIEGGHGSPSRENSRDEENILRGNHQEWRYIMKKKTPDNTSIRDNGQDTPAIDLDRARLMFEEYHIRAEKMKAKLSQRREESA